MINFIKRLFGIDKIEAVKHAADEAALAAIKSADDTKELERQIKMGPKELATENKEPWVAVLDTHVNKDNIRNGFFELDWNEYFVLQLKTNGYQGDTEESIVDQWFQDLCRNIGSEAGVDMGRRGSGFINVNGLADGKSEVY
jgi:hypothetical protein